MLIVVRLTGRAHVHQKLGHCIDAASAKTGRGAKAGAFYKKAKNLNAFLKWEPICHTPNI